VLVTPDATFARSVVTVPEAISSITFMLLVNKSSSTNYPPILSSFSPVNNPTTKEIIQNANMIPSTSVKTPDMLEVKAVVLLAKSPKKLPIDIFMLLF